DGGQWESMFDALMDRIAPRFARVEPRRRVRGFVLGLLSGLPGKNCWTISEHAGDDSPDGMQHLLRKAAGTTPRCVTTCAASSPSGWVMPARCWWSNSA